MYCFSFLSAGQSDGSCHTLRPHYAKRKRKSLCETHQMFSFCALVHTTPEEFENTTITDHFEFVFEENWGREIT